MGYVRFEVLMVVKMSLFCWAVTQSSHSITTQKNSIDIWDMLKANFILETSCIICM
jgi:hypothetical protein